MGQKLIFNMVDNEVAQDSVFNNIFVNPQRLQQNQHQRDRSLKKLQIRHNHQSSTCRYRECKETFELLLLFFF